MTNYLRMDTLEEYNSQPKNKKRFDHFFLGFIVSIILPIIAVVLISAEGNLASRTLYEHLIAAYSTGGMFVKYAILALIPNMILFFYLYKTERWKSANGLIVATILCMIFVVASM